ncbi:MAG TPA: DUF4446 family protein [Kribbella sp.]|nr:DUF4446 family protein [Kribbella sp.]
MSSTLAGVFGIVALLVAVLALVFSVQAVRAQHGQAAPTPPIPQPEAQSPAAQSPAGSTPEVRTTTVRTELRRLAKQLGATRLQLTETLQHLSVVRYDAFGDTGGQLSWSMALLNDHGDGVVLTSINSRNDARSYAKEVKGFASDSKLSPEEAEAIELLRAKASPPPGDPDHQ